MNTSVQATIVPADIVELAALEPVHYQEAFTFSATVERSPEDWARLILEDAPPTDRAKMLRTWCTLGVGLAAPGTAGQVLGWRIRHNGPDAIVLGMRAAVGVTARIILHAEPQNVVQAMLIRFDRLIAWPIWAMIQLALRTQDGLAACGGGLVSVYSTSDAPPLPP
jgi:hypothetical protein